MKMLFAQILACCLLLTVTLTSCDSKQPASTDLRTTATTTTAPEASTASKTTVESTTASTKAITTTAAAPEASTTNKTAVESATTTATAPETSTTSKTARPTAAPATRKPGDTAVDTKNEPYEDDSLLPGEDKQRLLFNADGGETVLVFEKAMRYPADNNAVLWHYIGTTKKGVQITCAVVPEQNAIREVSYNVNTSFGPMTYEKDARACLERFLKAYGIPYNADNAQISHSMAAKRGENGTVFHINWRFSLPLKENDGILSGKIGLVNGKLVVHSLYASSVLDEERVFGYSGDDIPLLIPRWKSE